MTPKPGEPRGGQIYIGIGGWTFEPWRGVFYPKIAPQIPQCEKAAWYGHFFCALVSLGDGTKRENDAIARGKAGEFGHGPFARCNQKNGRTSSRQPSQFSTGRASTASLGRNKMHSNTIRTLAAG
jgi:hypothetical protein